MNIHHSIRTVFEIDSEIVILSQRNHNLHFINSLVFRVCGAEGGGHMWVGDTCGRGSMATHFSQQMQFLTALLYQWHHEPPRAFAEPGEKFYLGPPRHHYFQTTRLKQVDSTLMH